MKYIDENGNIAIIKSSQADKDGNVMIQIDGEVTLMNYDEFIKRFNSSPKDK